MRKNQCSSMEPSPQEHEAALVAAAQRDPSAFDGLYVAYAESVFRYLCSRVGDRHEAEELTAQTFLAALEKFGSYRHRGHFAAWLFSIARNKAIDSFRRSKRLGDLADAEVLAGEGDLLAELADRQQIALLRRRIASLPPAHIELLRLRYVAGLPFAEIAVLLGRSQASVKKNLYRCLERLQRQLEEENV